MNIDMFPENYQDDIRKATNLLKNEGCKGIFLFGSLVTGDAHKNSDIDIGVTGLHPSKFFRVCASLDRELTNRVDLVDFDLNNDFYGLLSSLGKWLKLDNKKKKL